MNSYHFFNYDGSIDGLFSVIFDEYRVLENCHISIKKKQINFFNDETFIVTDKNKASRVKKSIAKNFGNNFLHMVLLVFASDFENKEDCIARTVKKMYLYGSKFLYSEEGDAVKFFGLQKEVGREIHAYKGLLRFKEIEGGVLFAEFTPKANILKFLTNHFKSRLKDEDFIIYDAKRNYGAFYFDGNLDFYMAENFEIKETDGENKFRNMWKDFYNSISIDERKNQKLMISNMPKKYWKYLPEKDLF